MLKNQNPNLSYPYGIIESVANVFTSNLLNDCSFSDHIIFCIDLYIWGSYFFVVTYQTSHGDDFVFEDSSLTSTTCTVMPTNSNRATVLRSNQVLFLQPHSYMGFVLVGHHNDIVSDYSRLHT